MTKSGGPYTVQVLKTAIPTSDGQKTLVRVMAAGLNYADVVIRSGLYPDAPRFPFVAGYELSGVVESPGRSSRFAAGDRVMGVTLFGAQAEYVLLDDEQLFPIPDGMNFEQAAALPVNYLTAYFALFRLGNLRSGERVLIHSCAGGVGTAAVQLAQSRKAEIFGTTSALHKIAYLESLGVQHPINYKNKDFAKEIRSIVGDRGIDMVLDPIGGKVFRKSFELLNRGGRIICYGVTDLVSGGKSNLPKLVWKYLNLPRVRVLDLIQDNRGVFGLALNRLVDKIELIAGPLRELINLYAQGIIRPKIGAVFQAEKASEAHRLLESGKSTGKLILNFGN